MTGYTHKFATKDILTEYPIEFHLAWWKCRWLFPEIHRHPLPLKWLFSAYISGKQLWIIFYCKGSWYKYSFHRNRRSLWQDVVPQRWSPANDLRAFLSRTGGTGQDRWDPWNDISLINAWKHNQCLTAYQPTTELSNQKNQYVGGTDRWTRPSPVGQL
jgi:hypothetical protein